MRYFRTKALVYSAIVLLALIAALPSLLPTSVLNHFPGWYADHTLTLGLDLRGGSHLLLRVETAQLQAERNQELADELSRRLRAAHIAHGTPVSTADSARLSLRSGADLAAARAVAQTLAREESPRRFRVDTQGQALILTPTSAAQAALRQDAVERSLEVVRRRLNETGVVEPLITRQGDDGVLVQLPGVDEPGRIKALLGKTARLTFHLVAGVDAPQDTVIEVPGSEPGESYRLARNPLLEGGQLTNASLGFNPDTREPVVNFSLNSQGGARFADITRANIGRAFAIVLDGEVITAPVIRTAIGGGSGQISGGFTAQSAADLALLLRAGALPAPLSVVEERTVGPDLGADAIRMGVQTGSLGAALTLAFMVLAYGRWGMIANAALLAYAVLVVAVLVTLGATLTLPGIAGLILSLGMAVDANILINERIREETRRGASARFALQQGFERAFGTILDSNVTTLIAVGLLFMFGTGPVRGFAVAMAVGLSVSLFTSVAVTRLLMEWRVRAAPRQPLVIGGLRWLDSIGQAGPIPFMKARGWGLVLSALLSLGSLLLLWQPGLNAGIDFEGGTLVEVRTAVPGNTETLRAALSRAGLDSVAIQAFGDDHGFLMRLPVQAGSQGAVETVRATLREASPGVQFPRVEVVGPSVSGGFFDTSVLAVILAGIGMFGYLWLRFERYFAVGAMLTLALDLTKTLGFFALTGLEFNLTAVAALLALIGYSVNDKVVVFDRIRENLRAGTTKPLRELIDESLTSTLTRTLFTSLTTFLALLPMGVAGGTAVASFALPLLFGVVVGTSSSILIAAPIVLVLGERAMLAAQQARSTPRATDDTLFLQEDRP